MITYDQHMQFLDREVQKQWDAFRELVAERQGCQDAFDFGKAVRDYTSARQQARYRLGINIGLTKLILERMEVPHAREYQGGGCGPVAIGSADRIGRAEVEG